MGSIFILVLTKQNLNIRADRKFTIQPHNYDMGLIKLTEVLFLRINIQLTILLLRTRN